MDAPHNFIYAASWCCVGVGSGECFVTVHLHAVLMYILGISAYYHDSAAVLIKDAGLIAAAQEERFTRNKHDLSFPVHAIRYCLNEAGISAGDVDHVAFYDKPILKFERLLETYLAFAPRGFASFVKSVPLWLKEKLFQKNLLGKSLKELDPSVDWNQKILFSEHHLSHAASAFFPSPFEEAVVLTIDGVGEWATTSVCIGRNNTLQVEKEIHFPHSLGLLYSAFTSYIGFKVNSGEYKVMGLAPYGRPRYAGLIKKHLIEIHKDGSFRLNMKYFDYCTGLKMTNNKFNILFGGEPRRPESELTQREMDLAASIQEVVEDVMLNLTRALAREYGIPNLCLAGGVALNCVANGKIVRDGAFEKIWVQPAAGDAGGALGAAVMTYHSHFNQPRVVHASDAMQGSYLGPQFANSEIKSRLDACGAIYEQVSDEDLIELVSRHIADEKAVGWFQGRMEFGPRALGARSILGNPASEKMQSILNLKIKYRESFRPFAPSVLEEKGNEWFDLDVPSPYMLIVAPVTMAKRITSDEAMGDKFGIELLKVKRSQIPAVTHVDYSARVQTVTEKTNPRYYRLIKSFEEKTGVPILINTSFNVRGEPIVCTPEDAFRCFIGTEMDVLAIGNFILKKQDQNPDLERNYKNLYELD